MLDSQSSNWLRTRTAAKVRTITTAADGAHREILHRHDPCAEAQTDTSLGAPFLDRYQRWL
jgi:hypothetical protein